MHMQHSVTLPFSTFLSGTRGFTIFLFKLFSTIRQTLLHSILRNCPNSGTVTNLVETNVLENLLDEQTLVIDLAST